MDSAIGIYSKGCHIKGGKKSKKHPKLLRGEGKLDEYKEINF
jgi:hypothetical protein